VKAGASPVYRRSPFLVCYWLEKYFVFENFATRRRITADPITSTILDFFQNGRTLRDFFTRFKEYDLSSLRRSVDLLVKHSMLDGTVREQAENCSPGKSTLQPWRQ